MLGFFVVRSVPLRLRIVAVCLSLQRPWMCGKEDSVNACVCILIPHWSCTDAQLLSRLIHLHRLAACALRCIRLHCVLVCELFE